MKSAAKKFSVILLMFFTMGCQSHKTSHKPGSKVQAKDPVTELYQENWSSLGKHDEAPQWFRDAKLGIYFHWGVYSVPAFDSEWYPRNMHFVDHRVYKHHVATYGEISEFGYHDFVPLFKAEEFDPEEWAELFQQAGAKFAGPVAEHHDGFSMWDSDITPWNVMDKGPKRDITGELKKALADRGIKLITTFHHAKHLQRSTELGKENPLSHYPYFEGLPPSSNDPELAYLYGNLPPGQWYREVWLGKLKEVVDKYQPDIMWFDYVLDDIPEPLRMEFCAYYLNRAAQSGQEVVLVRKQHDLPLSVSVEDLEQSRKNVIGTRPWMTDATISNGSWSYTENLGVKSSADILHMLIDITSKNGVLLLNISPKANGVIPGNQRQALLEMGEWLQKYGEAIYGTEAWYTFGEGPTKEPEGHFENRDAFHRLKYSNRDIRYTTKDYTIFAIVLGRLESGQSLLLNAFAPENILDPVRVEDVHFLGTEEVIEWSMQNEGLALQAPKTPIDEMATVIKIRISG